jgi:hypothetical protein
MNRGRRKQSIKWLVVDPERDAIARRARRNSVLGRLVTALQCAALGSGAAALTIIAGNLAGALAIHVVTGVPLSMPQFWTGAVLPTLEAALIGSTIVFPILLVLFVAGLLPRPNRSWGPITPDTRSAMEVTPETPLPPPRPPRSEL